MTEKPFVDTRKQLEEDARLIVHSGYVSVNDVIGWLDRQSAITENETRCRWVTAAADEIAAWRSKAEKLREENEGLQHERDELQSQVREYELRLGVVETERNHLRGNLKTEHNNFEQATTARESWKKRYEEAEREITVLQSKLDAYDETHIELPVDADGVPISVGDAVSCGSDKFIAFTLHDGYVFRECGFENGRYIVEAYEADELRHVKPRTVEGVLRDLVNYFSPNAEWTQLDNDAVTEYADELRELMGGDA